MFLRLGGFLGQILLDDVSFFSIVRNEKKREMYEKRREENNLNVR